VTSGLPVGSSRGRAKSVEHDPRHNQPGRRFPPGGQVTAPAVACRVWQERAIQRGRAGPAEGGPHRWVFLLVPVSGNRPHSNLCAFSNSCSKPGKRRQQPITGTVAGKIARAALFRARQRENAGGSSCARAVFLGDRVISSKVFGATESRIQCQSLVHAESCAAEG